MTNNNDPLTTIIICPHHPKLHLQSIVCYFQSHYHFLPQTSLFLQHCHLHHQGFCSETKLKTKQVLTIEQFTLILQNPHAISLPCLPSTKNCNLFFQPKSTAAGWSLQQRRFSIQDKKKVVHPTPTITVIWPGVNSCDLSNMMSVTFQTKASLNYNNLPLTSIIFKLLL